MTLGFKFIILIIISMLVALEATFSSRSKLKLYRLRDTWANIFIGVSTLMLSGLYVSVRLIAYRGFYQYAAFDLATNVNYWLSLLFLCDLVYFLFHFLGHKSRFFWASHVIHHSSKKYNLTTAIRSPITNVFYQFLFYAPLCLIGFKPLHVLLIESVIYMYTFYLHTTVIRKLGWMELIFNTPSHHRVHHGKDAKYIDKNFGGMFIIWDRLFGTFSEEEESPTFGANRRHNTDNPIKIVFIEWIVLHREIKRTKGWLACLKKIFGKP